MFRGYDMVELANRQPGVPVTAETQGTVLMVFQAEQGFACVIELHGSHAETYSAP